MTTQPSHALTIHQPWPWLIVKGHKPVENRSWAIAPKRLPLRIYIHAGASTVSMFNPGVWSFIREHLAPLALLEMEQAAFPLGAIVGEATITSCVRSHPSPFFVGPVGFVLWDVVGCEKPIPYLGQQGLFKVTAQELASARMRPSPRVVAMPPRQPSFAESKETNNA